jgi:hypothetical protein
VPRGTRHRLIAAGGLTAGATLAFSGVAQAAPTTYTVGTNADSSSGGACTTPTNSDCSLGEAVSLSNTNVDADTIVFNSNLTGTTITLTTGELSVTDGVTITGPGASQLTVTADGNSRIFAIDPATASDPVSISGLTLTDGDAGTGSGGAVYNEDAALAISSSVISESYATDNGQGGGGIYTNHGPLTLDDSSVSSSTGYYGGGIGSHFGAVTVANSTIFDNYATYYGGGIWTGGADLTVQGSTMSENGANEDGGAIYSSFQHVGVIGNPVTIENSTIVNNHAVTDDGGAVWMCCDQASADAGETLTVIGSTVTGNTAATMTGGLETYLDNSSPVLENSIVSGNSSGTTPATDDLYSYAAHPWQVSFSLVGVPSTYVVTTVPGSNLTGVDPQLGALADNGGPTQTMLPADTSPVIDCGSDAANPFDQRGAGFPRVVDQPNRTNSTAVGANGADIGAVEVAEDPAISGACANNAPVPPPVITPTPVQSPTGLRAAAKRRCKKKFRHNKPKLKKCLKRARRLPV